MDTNRPFRKLLEAQPTAPRAADQFALILVVVLYMGLRLWNITSYSLWGSESYGLAIARESWHSMLHSAVEDVAHPPLFYCLLKLWITMGGEGLLWIKLLPVLFAIATIVPFILLCRELRLSRGATSLALLLAACDGFLVHYAQEVRGYSQLLFLAVTSAWLFVRLFNADDQVPRKAAALSAVNLLMVYTHYHGWCVVGAEGLFLLIWGRHRLAAFAVSVAGVVIAFAPWAFLVTRVALGRTKIGSEWVPRPGLADLKLVSENLNGRPFPNVPGGALAGLLLFGMPVLLWAWQSLARSRTGQRDSIVLWWLTFLSPLPIVALYLTSQVSRQSLFLDRYLIFATLAYYALVAAAVHRLQPVRFRTAYICVLAAWSLIAGFGDLRSNRMAWEGAQMGSRVDWRSLTQRLVEAEPASAGEVPLYVLSIPSKGLAAGGWAISASMGFFLDEFAHQPWRPRVGPRGTMWSGRRGHFLTVSASNVSEILRTSPSEHFWVGYIRCGHCDPVPGHEPRQQLIENGLQVGSAIEQVENDNRVVLLPVWASH
ncbi:MAG TPA: glycosyltransferase family 39 protein [Gemmatimonadales bacterium]|nr:glycosyltransferase family 39 protein [Gemmatimonadales bacterium]